MIAQECGAQMLNGVNLGCIHHRLIIGAGHTDVKGGDGGAACLILAGYVYSWQECQVVDGKTGYLFHKIFSFLAEGCSCVFSIAQFGKGRKKNLRGVLNRKTGK